MDEDVSTQFICIIRNKKGLESPELYSVKLKKRDEKYYNYEKDKKIKGDIKAIISEKNKKIKDFKIERNPEHFFLIIEAHIPFLNEGEDDFSDLFEFLDFPGLNETETEEGNKNTFYYKDYLPLILPNIIFPIFIFEVFKFEGKESVNLINYYKNFSKIFNYPYLEEICNKTFNEAFFILNKIDLFSDPDKKNEQIQVFRKQFELNNNNSLFFSSKEKLLNNNKFNSFYQYINYVIEDKSPYSENFIEQLNYKYEKELNTKIVK